MALTRMLHIIYTPKIQQLIPPERRSATQIGVDEQKAILGIHLNFLLM